MLIYLHSRWSFFNHQPEMWIQTVPLMNLKIKKQGGYQEMNDQATSFAAGCCVCFLALTRQHAFLWKI